MSLRIVLSERRHEIHGSNATESGISLLRRRVAPELPIWLTTCLCEDHVIGVRFQFDRPDTEGGEVALSWLSPEMMVSEATEAFPGIAVVAMGYIPIGACLRGSGDPYFLRLDGSDDPPLVRIYHDCIGPDGRPFGKWCEVIADRVSVFVSIARIG